ncbi:MAG: hypothetical protein ACO1OB_24730 [Archangium sp.]
MRSTFTASSCFRVASSLETTRRGLLEAAKELGAADDDAGRLAAEALRIAEAELMRARRALQATAASVSPLQMA